ncbi:MAG TPA: nicotinate-nucleotide adenylyltransferase [Burkholderiaceae bacterium]|nr:nicotinate-nucleotide adenylyltransferase [Burkholderiaceae bacterium]
MRIGLFGGSFDPVHNAHLALARAALAHLKLDQLHWVPAGQPWQKTQGPQARILAPAPHRVAMVELAIAGEERFLLNTTEVDRDGPSYTIDTVRELQAHFSSAQVFLLIGQDQYNGLPTWRDWRELLSRVTLAIAVRGKGSLVPPPQMAAVWHRAEILPMAPMNLSSTAIRHHVANGGLAMDLAPTLVPEAVARYIDQHRLYAGAAHHPTELNGHS